MSEGRSALRALVLGGLAALMLVAFGAQSAWAEPSTHCVKATKVSKVISGKTKHVYTGGWNDKGCTSVNATHEGKYEKLTYLTPEQESKLTALLTHVNVVEKGVDSKPTVQFTGANVQVVNGEGKTNTTNGEGNLVVGYDESAFPQTGSHNIVAGEHDEYTSYGGLVVAFESGLTAPFGVVFGAHNGTRTKYATVTGGELNTASGESASVSGGTENTASGVGTSVSGGSFNKATGKFSSLSGGDQNAASGEWSSVSGGSANHASGFAASLSGGVNNSATSSDSSVSGGQFNVSSNLASSVTGGERNTATGELSSVTGGFKNKAEGKWSSIFGGKELLAHFEYEAIP